jgi:translation initiation factor RLI1
VALSSELPIYKVAYDLSDLAIDLVRNMPRDVKGVIGGELRDQALMLVVLIYRANVAREKAAHLMEIVERLQVVELLLRLARDKRFISVKQYAMAIGLTGSIGKQATAWRKSASTSPAT